MLACEQKKTSYPNYFSLPQPRMVMDGAFPLRRQTLDAYIEIKVIVKTDKSLFTFAGPCVFYMPILKPHGKERLLCVPLTLFLCVSSSNVSLFFPCISRLVAETRLFLKTDRWSYNSARISHCYNKEIKKEHEMFPNRIGKLAACSREEMDLHDCIPH